MSPKNILGQFNVIQTCIYFSGSTLQNLLKLLMSFVENELSLDIFLNANRVL